MGKQLSEQSDERGVCGHAFNELRTRPEEERRREGAREKRTSTLRNPCISLGRGQVPPPAVTFPSSTHPQHQHHPLWKFHFRSVCQRLSVSNARKFLIDVFNTGELTRTECFVSLAKASTAFIHGR